MEFGGNEKGKIGFENGEEREGNGLDAIDRPWQSSEIERDSP